MYAVLSGASGALALVVASLFLRAYARTHRRFFALFSAAFALQGLTSLALGIQNAPETNQPASFLPRLAVYVLILIAIAESNRSRTGRDEVAERRSRSNSPLTPPMQQRSPSRR